MPDRPVSAAEAVTVAYVHDLEVAHSWHACYINLLGHDLATHQRVVRGGFIAMRCGTGGIVAARNETIERFLDSRDADWLWWVDTDMGFAPDTVDRLLAAADPTDRPIMGGLCFAQREIDRDGMGGFRCRPVPTLYRWVQVGDGQQGFTAWLDYPADQVVPVAGTGSACILIHRSVLEKVAQQYGPNWYTRMTNPSTGQLIGEDLSFCAKAAACGFPLHVDTSVKTTHLKAVWLAEGDYAQAVAATAAFNAPTVDELDTVQVEP